MKQFQVLQTVFPELLTEYFDFTDYKESADKLDYWLEEREYMTREDYRKGTVRSHGLTEETVIQDFPIRGKAVYFHIKRRRWIDKADGQTFVYHYDFAEEGSKLSPEFVAFLKGTD